MKKHAPRTIITHEPMYLTVGVSGTPLDGLRALLVFVSPIIRAYDPIYQPVAEFLAGSCNRLDSDEWVEDREMMRGGADRRIYSVWSACPGSTVEHECVRDSVRV